MNGLPLIQTNKEKEFGIIVSQDLSWTANAERRCEKAIKAFCTIKPNIAKRTNCQAKKNLFRSYIVAVKSYGAILWKAIKVDLRRLKKLLQSGYWELSDCDIKNDSKDCCFYPYHFTTKCTYILFLVT